MRYTAAVITVSDKGFRGERKDTSGPALCSMLEEAGWEICHYSIVPDEADLIKKQLTQCCDVLNADLVLTTGGTGFSPRDITPEATKEIIEREAPGIPEAMRAESMRITPMGCLSRSFAGIRGRSLIINLPGSEKAARENILAVLAPVKHGVEMLKGEGSADCADRVHTPAKKAPSLDLWLKEAKEDEHAKECGMFLFHNGTVRCTAKAQVRQGIESSPVTGMEFSYDKEKLDAAVAAAKSMPGIYYVRVWLNEGTLSIGDDIMLALVGGDIRPRVLDALTALVSDIKNTCVTEKELS